MGRRVAQGAAVTALLCAPLGGCAEGGGAGGGSPAGGLAVLCADQAAESLDPFLSPDQLAADLGALLFTPLVRYGAGGGIEPWLAETWSWSEERRGLELQIRDDVLWHDGRRVTAEDVAWTLRTAADPEIGAWSGPDLETLEAASAPDSVTVRLRFSEPFAAGLEPFVTLPILPHHLLSGLDPEAFARAEYHREPVGSGPYRLAARNPDGTLLFERWERFPEALGRPGLERLAFRPVTEDATLAAELRTGGVHACVTGAALAGALASARDVQLHRLEPPAIQVLVLDTRRPLFRDPRLRRALSAALVRRDLASTVSPAARAATTLLPPSSPWRNPELGLPDADPGLADSLLDAAGWGTLGPDSVRRDAAGQPLRFTLAAPTQMRTTVTAVQGQLRRAGIAVELRFLEWAAYVRLLQDPEARPEAMALAFVPDRILYPDPSGTYRSGSPMNIASYASAEADSLLDAIAAAREEEERREAWRGLQARLVEDAPVIYLVYVPRLLAVGPRLAGVQPGLGGPFARITEWRVAGAASEE